MLGAKSTRKVKFKRRCKRKIKGKKSKTQRKEGVGAEVEKEIM